MASRQILFDAQTLLNLLTSYSDGRVPMDAKLVNAQYHVMLPQRVILWVESNQWPFEERIPFSDKYPPLHIRYDGKHILRWSQQSDKGGNPQWSREWETPKGGR